MLRPMRGWAWCALVVAGCRGETVLDEPVDARADSVADTSVADARVDDAPVVDISLADAGGCPTGTANLVSNSSLDAWSATLPDFYTLNTGVTAAKVTGDDAGGTVARLTWSAVGYGLYQRVTLPKPLPIGCKVRVRGRARWVSGAAAAPSLIASLADTTGDAMTDGSAFASWSADGTWHEHSLVVVADRVTATVAGFFVGNVMTTQTVDVDDLEITYAP